MLIYTIASVREARIEDKGHKYTKKVKVTVKRKEQTVSKQLL